MSRLDEECIMAVVRNRSGIDSGEIDCHLNLDMFERMSLGDLDDTLRTLDVLASLCLKRVGELKDVEPSHD